MWRAGESLVGLVAIAAASACMSDGLAKLSSILRKNPDDALPDFAVFHESFESFLLCQCMISQTLLHFSSDA